MPDIKQTQLAAGVERVLETIRVMGGRQLPEPCEGRDLGPVEGRPHLARDFTVGCGAHSRFELPYRREDSEPATLTACVVDDWAARWPVLAP